MQSDHEHDPGGTKRDVTTGKVQRVGNNNPNPAPIDVGRYDYREVNAADGAHYSELTYPVKRNGQPAAAMELHYDLKDLDPDQAPPRHPPAGHRRLGLRTPRPRPGRGLALRPLDLDSIYRVLSFVGLGLLLLGALSRISACGLGSRRRRA